MYMKSFTVQVDVLDPEDFDKCSWAEIKRPGPLGADSRKTSDTSLSLLNSSLLQAATDPHRHHLCITVIILYDEGMILKSKKTENTADSMSLFDKYIFKSLEQS